jgi:uncharacterized protein YjbI with pentapeptide repeats
MDAVSILVAFGVLLTVTGSILAVRVLGLWPTQQRIVSKFLSRHRTVLLALSGLLVSGLALSVIAAWCSDDWIGFLLNLGTELVGAALTYFLFNQFIERRAEKERLIAEMGSRVNDRAVAAVEGLRQREWLTDGSLQGVNLQKANLQGADLRFANLQGAGLWRTKLQGALIGRGNLQEAFLGAANLSEASLMGANLQDASLMGANLQEADLQSASLKGTNLQKANLQGADLQRANLQEADLQSANLQGTLLHGANLKGTNMYDANFDENTVLPDRTKWHSRTDISRFTDPEHPDFWRSDRPHSPAYRGSE